MKNLHLSFVLVAALGAPCLTACQPDAGVVSGDYSVFRVASVSEPKLSGQCGEDPDPTSTHKSTFRAGGTFLGYGVTTSKGDQLYLDIGGDVLAGSLKDDGSYEFKGSITDTHNVGGKTIFDSDHDGVDDSDEPTVDADGDGLNDKSTDPMVDVDADGLDDRGEDSIVDADSDGKDDRNVTLPGDTTLTNTSNLTITFMPSGSTITGNVVQKVSSSCDGECTGIDNLSCTSTSSFVGVQIDDSSVAVPIGDGTSDSTGTPAN